MITLDRSTAAKIILAVRFSLGPLCVFFPRLTTRLMLLDPDANPASSYLVRLFGIRDTFLGVAAFVVQEPARGKIIGYAAAVDLTDATAAVLAGLTRKISPRAAVLAAVSGLTGACLGAAAVGRGPLGRREPTPPTDL